MGIVLAVAVWLVFSSSGEYVGWLNRFNEGLINGAITLLLRIVGRVIGIRSLSEADWA